MAKKIIFTGGGTAGHVIPNLALIEKFLKENWEVCYIGSKTGIEKELIFKLGIPYYPIATGKLRRYFSWQNFIDPLKIILGVIQVFFLLLKLKPNIIFSKGGFVSFPVVVAAKMLRIPVIIHESDLTVGLANKLSFPFADKICITFPDTANYIKKREKVVISGMPIKNIFLNRDPEFGRKVCGFDNAKKILLVFGGSLGAEGVNRIIRQLLPEILKKFYVVHICGKGKTSSDCEYSGYKQFEYLDEEFPHVLAAADLVIARSGANTVYELIALRKPNILLPLAKSASRGDQILNAQYGVSKGFSEMILQEELTSDLLLEKTKEVEEKRETMVKAMEGFEVIPAVEVIYKLVEDGVRT